MLPGAQKIKNTLNFFVDNMEVLLEITAFMEEQNSIKRDTQKKYKN